VPLTRWGGWGSNPRPRDYESSAYCSTLVCDKAKRPLTRGDTRGVAQSRDIARNLLAVDRLSGE